jgi:hypothetical protein
MASGLAKTSYYLQAGTIAAIGLLFVIFKEQEMRDGTRTQGMAE